MNKLRNQGGLIMLVGMLIGFSLMAIEMGKNSAKASKHDSQDEQKTPGVDMGRFNILDSFQMFDDNTLSKGMVIQDRKNPGLCFFYVVDESMEGGTAMEKVSCQFSTRN